jgi:DnaJ family protein C protein 7
MPDGEDTVLSEGMKEGPPPPASPSEDPSPPQPQPQSEPEPVLEPEPEPDPAAIAAEAEKLKEQGNESFKRARYGEAVDLYTKAIGMSSSSSSLPSSSLSSFLPLPFHP